MWSSGLTAGALTRLLEHSTDRWSTQPIAGALNRSLERSTDRWSAQPLECRLALAVCPAAYEATKSFSLLQLPSRSTLRSYTCTGAFLEDAGR